MEASSFILLGGQILPGRDFFGAHNGQGGWWSKTYLGRIGRTGLVDPGVPMAQHYR